MLVAVALRRFEERHTDTMTTRLSIGDFSRMTYLGVKALRNYHDLGLLVPSEVDAATGYRYYDRSQVAIGQVVRRFRDLGMPLEHIKEVLNTTDPAIRNELIVAHLRQMESALEQTQHAVSSLRSLLERPRAALAVEYRTVRSTSAIAVAEVVPMADLEGWWSEAFAELHGVLESSGTGRVGPDSALYSAEFFEEELGEVVAFVPVAGAPISSRRVKPAEIPAAELAVTVHTGSFADLDLTYGALGTFVAEREIGVQGPIREHYLVGFDESSDESLHRTEVAWPVFHTKAPT